VSQSLETRVVRVAAAKTREISEKETSGKVKQQRRKRQQQIRENLNEPIEQNINGSFQSARVKERNISRSACRSSSIGRACAD
jgi:hypothetical protein